MKIEIEYDGAFPNLCSGALAATIDRKRWEFPPRCLSSGGSVWFDDGWREHVESGPWSINKWPEGFPEDQKKAVQDALNVEMTREEYDSLSEE